MQGKNSMQKFRASKKQNISNKGTKYKKNTATDFL
jgi:hypothetical protein